MKNKKNQRKPFFRFIKKIMRLFATKPTVINHNEDGIADKSIIVSNHSGASGPIQLELYLDHYFVPWGTHEMNGNIKERWNYLTNVYFTQKKHLSKFVAVLISIPAVFVLKWFYKGIELLSTYKDSRLKETFDKSVERLDKNQSILIYPENSSEGYKEVLEEFYPGFVTLSKIYYRKRGEDLPVYPVYVFKQEEVLLVGKPQYIQPLIKQGMTKEQIATHFMGAVNQLREDYLKEKELKQQAETNATEQTEKEETAVTEQENKQ